MSEERVEAELREAIEFALSLGLSPEQVQDALDSVAERDVEKARRRPIADWIIR